MKLDTPAKLYDYVFENKLDIVKREGNKIYVVDYKTRREVWILTINFK